MAGTAAGNGLSTAAASVDALYQAYRREYCTPPAFAPGALVPANMSSCVYFFLFLSSFSLSLQREGPRARPAREHNPPAPFHSHHHPTPNPPTPTQPPASPSSSPWATATCPWATGP